ncbi:hypothetical protein [Streptomyces sp. B6B3]|uniref:hypothetical protein n=1 Tax=Streptomyces sp. B6B3 TaxID=3153570 RepID=UPI00325E6DB7
MGAAFSPVAVSGALVLDMVEDTRISVSAPALFFASFGFSLLLSLITFALLHRRAGSRVLAARPEGSSNQEPAAADADGASDADRDERGVTWRQGLTLCALVVLVVGALVFELEIGFLALAAGAALAISTTIVDVSPFSTNGALVLSNARGVSRERFYRQVVSYTVGIVGIGPVLAWGALVIVPWAL